MHIQMDSSIWFHLQQLRAHNGISNKATFQAACEHASGAIIGSRFVTLLEEEKDPEKAILKLKEALR